MLRAGLGFLHAAQELLPNADVGFIGDGPRRGDASCPKPYVNKLPESLAGRPVHRARPDARHRRLAGAHVSSCCIERGAPAPITVVCVLAAPEGIAALERPRPRPRVVTAAIDEHLNEHAFIVPGLGDAGDRQFGSPA